MVSDGAGCRHSCSLHHHHFTFVDTEASRLWSLDLLSRDLRYADDAGHSHLHPRPPADCSFVNKESPLWGGGWCSACGGGDGGGVFPSRTVKRIRADSCDLSFFLFGWMFHGHRSTRSSGLTKLKGPFIKPKMPF